MEYKDLQQQLEALMSLGYSREEIIKMAKTAPTIFRYTPEGIKSILNLINLPKEELLNIVNNTHSIVENDEGLKKR